MALIVKMSLVILVCIMVATATYAVDGAVTCQMVVSSFTPCITYLLRGGPVPPSCCSGINSLFKAATTTTDRQTACKCMEQATGMIPRISLNAARNLPRKCGLNIPYKISPNVDGSKY